jgi:catechol 2,3-dioxygenase-like lactoylglutathione lyase family enzyme
MRLMRLMHLGLPVQDEERSLRFYATYFGFDPATAQRYDDGTVILRNADGFDLALHGGQEVGSLPAFLHFGFRLSDADAVRRALERVRADRVVVVEEYDEPEHVSFKCPDPDGHRVEVYWEPSPAPT